MPKRKTHDDINLLFLGKRFSEVNQAMDLPAKVVGASHRKFLHSMPEAFLLGVLFTGDVNGGIGGVLHVIVDSVDSSSKREFKKIIKKVGENECQKKKKITRKRKKRNT